MTDNPLLQASALPQFARIRPEHVQPAVRQLLETWREGIAQLLDAAGPRSFDNTLLPQEALEHLSERVWSPVSHLHAVMDSEALRQVYAPAEEALSDFAAELGQNRALYAAVRAVADDAGFADLPRAARALVQHALRDFRLAGVALDEPARSRFREISNALTRLGTQFEEAVLDATQAWFEQLDEAALAGLPDAEREALRDTEHGGYRVTLQHPSVQAVLTYANDRALRQRVYNAYHTRASEQGPDAGRFDNSARIEQILALRHEAAQLLGFANAAEESLATKMAGAPAQVLEFLADLVARARPVAQVELQALRAFASGTLGIDALQPWDVAYASEKLREQRFDLREEELKPYFAQPAVLAGLFAIVERVFGVRLRERFGVQVWHPNVHFYELLDADGKVRAGCYVDLFARKGKRGGAWMDVCRSRMHDAQHAEMPIAYLTCNFPPPGKDRPSLLSHDEVTTLFHEFGHGLHHLLTEVDYPSVAGIDGVEWDAVELPSQFMENFCWQREALDLFARHWRSGERLPDALFQRMLAARHFHAGLFLVRQLEFALFDFRLHLEYDPARGARALEVLQAVRHEVAVMDAPPWQRMPHAFTHVFSGGYAAGYYSYLWAELLSADAFARFEEAGIFDAATGKAFRDSILAVGGSRPALESFIEFRGRAPQPDALLRSYGLAA